MRNRVRIVLLLPDLRGGGAERAALGFASGLSRERFEVHLAVCEHVGELVSRVPADVPVHCLGANAISALAQNAYRFRRLARRLAPKVVVSFLWFADAIQLIARRSDAPWKALISLHTVPRTLRHERFGALKCALMRQIYPTVDGVMAVSSRIVEEFLECYPATSAATQWVQPNPFPFAEILADGLVESRDWVRSRGCRVVAVGRLDPGKGFDLLFEAMARLPPDLPWELMLVGDGDERRRLEALSRKLQINNRVRFAGFRQNPYSLMASADVLVVSSHAEAFPNVIIEAQILGTAVISTDCPSGPGLMIDDGVNGRLVAPGDADTLASVIAELLSDPEARARYAAAARARVASFEASRAVDTLEQHLLDFLGES